MSTQQEPVIRAVRRALSAARLSTFERAVVSKSVEDPAPLGLYTWNAVISGSLLAPLQVCEVIVRNAVSDALESIYGSEWPWNRSFEGSLPHGRKNDLLEARKAAEGTDTVIPQLSFFFWQSLFTARHDERIWTPWIDVVFPNYTSRLPSRIKRKNIYDELEQIRRLRNRIAHHEPIFMRNLSDDYRKITHVVALRCAITAHWLNSFQTFSQQLTLRPALAHEKMRSRSHSDLSSLASPR